MGYSISLYNKMHYQQTGNYKVQSFSPNFKWGEVVERLGVKKGDEFAIASYNLPLMIEGNDFNTVIQWFASGLGEVVIEIEATVYAKYLKELADHFFNGDVKSTMRQIESLRFYRGHDLSHLHCEAKNVKAWLSKHSTKLNIEDMMESMTRSISKILMVDDGIFIKGNDISEIILECVLNTA